MYLFCIDLAIYWLFFEHLGILGDIDSNGGITDRSRTIVSHDRSVRDHFWDANWQDVFNQYIGTAIVGYRRTGKSKMPFQILRKITRYYTNK